jgi:hypothetical protein
MAKCLRCGAGAEWIQGRVPDEVPVQEPANQPDAIPRCKDCGAVDGHYSSCGTTDQQAVSMQDAPQPTDGTDKQSMQACTTEKQTLVQQIPCPRCDGPLYHYPRDRRYTWPICGKCGYDTQLPAGLDQVPWTASDKSSGDVL